MNKHLRETLNNASKSIGNAVDNTSNSLSSLLRMMILSRYGVACKAKHYPKLKQSKDCTILANGPSLKEALENNEVRLAGNDVFVVNMFVNSPEFRTIKPRFYFLVDSAFFAPSKDRHFNLISELAEALNKVSWDMYLCISSGCVNGGLIKELHNDRIKVIRWNTTTFEGFKGLCHFMYRHNMAMPRCQTVTNMALSAAINMGYDNVYLYGADHSWTRDLRVDDDNVVCYGDRHVYATNLEVIKKDYSIGILLEHFANMFHSHWIINDYAKSMGVKIWNCTKGSFIDAYQRKY